MNKLLTYLNTKQYFTNHWKCDVFSNAFYLSDAELKRWSITRLQLEALPQVKTVGMNKYNIVGVNEINTSLLKPTGRPLTDLHRWMLDRLQETELPNEMEVSPYWNTFFNHRERFPEFFFKVDTFSGRVHTPITGMSHLIRPNLILRNEKTVSLDVSQMQPTLLGAILKNSVGTNSFSQAIDEGLDIYSMLQSTAQLDGRKEGKKRFFEILFGKPNDQLTKMLKGANWLDWINQYKSADEPRNPNGREKQYSNLAWLLQTYEVQIMSKIWRELAEKAIPFLTVHDEIIVQEQHLQQATEIMTNILNKHFIKFKINTK